VFDGIDVIYTYIINEYLNLYTTWWLHSNQEEKYLRIKREKNEWKKTVRVCSFIKRTRCCRSVNKNVTQQRKDEDEEQRVTDRTCWILLGMSTTTAYMTMTTECRNWLGIKCYFEFATDVLTFRGWTDLDSGEKKQAQIIIFTSQFLKKLFSF
jgi:hypothetical protein